MDLFSFYRNNPAIAEEEKKRREMNARMYGILSGDVVDKTQEDVEQMDNFMKDTLTFMTLYDDKVATEYYRPQLEEEQRKIQEAASGQADDFTRRFIKESGPRSEEEKKMLDRGMRIRPYLDFTTGELTSDPTLTAQNARDFLAFGRENMLALSGVEDTSIYNTTLLYSGNDSIFGPLEEEAPDFFKPTQEELDNIDQALLYSSSWGRTLTLGLGDKPEGMEDVSKDHFALFENFAAWGGEVLPTDFLGGKEQEGWDGAAAWELLKKSDPGFAAYLEQEVGLDPKALALTPNHWEFRYAINERVQLGSLGRLI